MTNEAYYRWLQNRNNPPQQAPPSVQSEVAGVRSGAGLDAISNPIRGAIGGPFHAIGTTASSVIRQDDEYGVADSDWQAGVGAVFNPGDQTNDMIADIGKGNWEGALGNALIIGGAIETNKKRRQARDRAKMRIKAYENSLVPRAEPSAPVENTDIGITPRLNNAYSGFYSRGL